uniref:Nonribosomal peptide synthetase n=1 Tax=Pyrenophora dematioidea TaxID=139229 RepID=LAN2_PYRDE|nr:NRPS [Pyrenophora dematioidea]
MSPHISPSKDTPSQRLPIPLSLPTHLGLLAKAYGVPPASILQLAWGLVLRCYFTTSSSRWGTIDMAHEYKEKKNLPIRCEVLELDDTRSIGWILQNWNDPSVHRHLPAEEDTSNVPVSAGSIVILTEDAKDLEVLRDFELTAEWIICFSTSTEKPLLRLSWRPDVIHSELASHLAQLLERALDTTFLSPDIPLSQINLFSILDHQKLLQWNHQYPQSVNRLVHEMFEDMVAARPQATAVAAWDGEVTYQQLDRLSTRLAIKLQTIDLQPESIVALCFEKSVWAIVAMLGVLRAGGAFLHIDPKHPTARQQAMISTTAARIILCSEQTRDTVSRFDSESLSLVVDRKMFAQEPDHKQVALPSPNNLGPRNAAYIVCTSGSTGLPKAIVVEHVSLCTSVTAQAEAMAVGGESRILQYAAYTFDVSVGDVFTALTHGACVCIPSDWERTQDLVGAINRLDVNQACLTSTVASFLTPMNVPKLQKLTLGGEPASKQCIDLWSGKVALKNVYGPAECTVWCVIQKNASSEIPASNIGRGIGARTWIVHPENHNQLMPIGAVGELLIEGPLVARGYLNDAERTTAVFLERAPSWLATFGPLPPQTRFYKTGDLARFEQNGTLFFEGRKDTQVKLRGQRIELGEIEYQIQQACNPVPPLAVELIETKDLQAPLLGAFITWTGGLEISLDQSAVPNGLGPDLDARSHFNELVSRIQANIDRTLPPYMMPGLYIPVQKLPLSTSGKLDRKVLRQYCTQHTRSFLTASEAESSDVIADDATKDDVALHEIVNPGEITLAQLWAHALGRRMESINAKDNFLSLGGDSLAAMRLVNLAARDAQVTLTVANIFESPVLADQARLLRPLSKTKSLAPFELMTRGEASIEDIVGFAAQQCRLLPAQIEDVYPCTPLQEEMMRDSLSNDRTQMGQEVVQISEELDLVRYQVACASVYRRFPILRTRFIEHSGRLVQVVVREDLCWKQPTSLAEYKALDSRERPALGKPLTRWALTSDGTHFILSLHHAMFDGITLGQIQGAIYAVYQCIPLPPPSVSFATFLAHLDDQNAPLSQESQRFWQSYLCPSASLDASITPETQKIDRPRASCGTQRLVQFTSGEVSALQRHGLTEATLVRGAWACTLARHQQKPHASAFSDVIFGTMLTGRNFHLPGVDMLAAPSLTHVPIRIRIDEGDLNGHSARALLARVQADATAMIPYEHDGMNRIRSIEVQTRAVFNRIRTLLVIQPIPEGLTSVSTSPFPGSIVSGPRVEAKEMGHFHWYGLLVECTLLPTKGFFVRVSYDNKMFGTEQVESLLDDYSTTLHTLANGLMDTDIPASLHV